MQVYMQLTLSKCEFLLWSRVLSAVGLYFFFKILFIYLTERAQSGWGEWQAEGEGEAGSPLSREPDVGLNPSTLGS